MSVRAIIVKNPFNRKQRDIKSLEFHGETIEQLKDTHLPKDLDVVVSINGIVIEKQFWNTAVPRLGDEVVFMPVVGKDEIWGAVLMITLAVVGAPYLAGVITGATSGFAYTMAMAATILAGGILINSLMPQPQLPSYDADIPQVYSWNPATVQRQGIVRPRFYGKNKLYGNVISVFTEPDDGDDTQQLLNMLIGLGSGPVKGITKSDGTNYDIRINGQPIQNFEDVSTEEKLGTLEQTAISLFTDTKPEYRPNRVITHDGGAEVYTTPDNDFDDLEIEILFDRGIYYANDEGGLSNYSVSIQIEISEHDADSYSTLCDLTITDNTTEAIRKSYIASENYTGGSPVSITRGTKYDIRITKKTDDKGARYGNSVRLSAVREVMEDGFKYPGLSLLAISALATDQLSGAMEVDVIQEGRAVRVYDDGEETWSIEYSDNPAWVLYDVLTQPIISGDGDETPYAVEKYEGISTSRLDLNSFVELADFCDELVPSGIGEGTEKRITFNGGFDTATTLWEAALKICEIARCVLVWDGVDLSVVIDTSASVTQMFNVGNISKDSFKQTFLSQAERASEIEVHYRDESQDFKQVPFSIYNSLAGNFENKVVVELFGTTKQSEAWRAGMFRLAQNILLKSVIEFEADIDAIACTVGDVIYVQHDVPDWKEGGRVISSTNNTIVVDKEVTPSGGTDKVLVRVYNPETEAEEIENHTVSGVDGKTITISDTWTTNPSEGDIFCYGTSADTARKYRITDMSVSSEQRIKITAIEYNEDVYTYDDDNPTIPISDYDAPVSDDNATKPPTFDEIRREYPKSLQGIPTLDIPITHNLLWSGNEVDTVGWEAEDGENPILLTYKGTTYEITADDTTSTYIYWDLNDSNNTFKATDTLANAIGADKWLMCLNDAGEEHPAWGISVLHGGFIKAGTLSVDTADIEDAAITEAKIDDAAITTAKIDDLNVTTLKINNYAVTITSSSFTSGTVTISGTTTIQTLAVTSGGGELHISFSWALVTGIQIYPYAFTVYIYRDTSLIYQTSDMNSIGGGFISGYYVDYPDAGNYTYYLKVSRNNGYSFNAGTRSLRAQEVKK